MRESSTPRALSCWPPPSDSLSAAEDEDTDADRQRFSNERETVESRLSEALGLALTADTLASLPGAGGFGDDIVSRVRATPGCGSSWPADSTTTR